MWELFNTSAFAPFVIAGFVLIILLAVEMLGFFFGGVSGFLDNLLPESLIDADFDADTGANMDMNADGDMSLGLKALDWLYVGRIPTMILLILFIASFCVTGFIIQQLAYSFLGHFISPWLATLDAVVISFPLLKIIAALLYPILPKDESSAVTGDSLVGKPARILLGSASIGHPAQAKIVDEHGQSHFVMVEPEPSLFADDNVDTLELAKSKSPSINPTDISSTKLFTAEDKLIITKKVGGRYLAKKL